MLTLVPVKHDIPTAKRIAAAALICGFTLAIGASHFVEMPKAVEAQGTVVPSSRVQPVAVNEAGQIKELLVKVGDHVAADQVIARLDGTAQAADLGQLKVDLEAAKAAVARLEAEAVGKDFTGEGLPAQVREAAVRQFRARKAKRAAELASLRATINDTSAAVASIQRQLASRQELMAKGVVSVRDEKSAGLEATIAEKRGTINSASQKLAEAEAKAIEETDAELAEARRKRDGLVEQMAKQERRVAVAELRAPVAGVVKTLSVNGPGYVQAGQFAEIVPADERPVVSVKLSAVDRPAVEVGKLAKIQLSGHQYGAIDGTVTVIAPDADIDPKGASQPTFRVDVQTDAQGWQVGGRLVPLVPGMQVTALIVERDRSLFAALFGPLLRAGGNAAAKM